MPKIVVGRFASVHGVKGDIRVNSFTEPRKNILEYLPWQIRRSGSQEWHTIEISHSMWHGEELIVRLKNVNDREEAKKYTNLDIAIERDQLPKLPESQDQHYWSDLLGLTVVNTHGITLGTVESYFETGANEVMVVKGNHEYLIPYTHYAIVKVDLTDQTIVVDWDEEE